MKNNALIFLFLIMLFGCNSQKELAGGKVGVIRKCPVGEQYVCVIPFSVVYSIPVYSKKDLYNIKGYLAFEDGQHVLYPSQEAMTYGVKESAILINCTCDMQSEFVTMHEGEFVGVTGYFSDERPHHNSEEYWVTINTKDLPNPSGILNRGPPPIAPPPPEE
jgi:hypothetical protein